MPAPSVPLQFRLAAKTSPEPNTGCWLWTGTTNKKGYGHICTGKRGVVVHTHRAAWTLVRGDIPDGLHVLHRCDTPQCVNVDHLFLGTNDENIRDKVSKGRAATKLSPADVVAIRASDAIQAVIARQYGISPRMVWLIRHGESWKSLTPALHV